jgi:hypothetical protein
LTVTKGGRVHLDASMLNDTQDLELSGKELLSWQLNPFSCNADELATNLITMFKHFSLLETFNIPESTVSDSNLCDSIP